MKPVCPAVYGVASMPVYQARLSREEGDHRCGEVEPPDVNSFDKDSGS